MRHFAVGLLALSLSCVAPPACAQPEKGAKFETVETISAQELADLLPVETFVSRSGPSLLYYAFDTESGRARRDGFICIGIVVALLNEFTGEKAVVLKVWGREGVVALEDASLTASRAQDSAILGFGKLGAACSGKAPANCLDSLANVSIRTDGAVYANGNKIGAVGVK